MKYWRVAVLLWGGSCVALLAMAAQAVAGPAGASFRFLDEPAEGPFDLVTTVRASGAGEARVCLGYRGPGDFYYVRITPRELALVRVEKGKARQLSSPYRLGTPLGANPTPLVVKRRPEKIALICRGVLLQVVGDLDPGGGKVGFASNGGVQVEPPRLQPVEPPAFADDFMREATEASPWETAAGQWNTTTVGDVKKSANGFSYRGAGNPGIATVGFPFWDDYVVQASFKAAQEDGTVGLAAYYQDPKNYLALSWSSQHGLRLLRVRDGATQVLATKRAAWVPHQWYRIGLQAVDGRLTATVDGRVCLEAEDFSFGRGKAALLVEGQEFYWDDIAVKPAVYWRDPAPWQHRDRWAPVGNLRIAGSTGWQDYTIRVRATPTDRNGLGIVFGWRSPSDYYLLRWGAEAANAPGTGRKQIIRVNGPKRVVVAEATGGYQIRRAYRIETTVRPGYAAVSIDGKRALQTADAGLQSGAIGLSPLSPSVNDVSVTLYEEPPPPEEEVTKEFTDSNAHPDMAEWANPAKAWIPRLASQVGPVFWRKGDYFGDVTVQVPLPPLNQQAQVSIFLCANGENLQSGYAFLARSPKPGRLSLQLLRQAVPSPVASAAANVPTDRPCSLRLARLGDFVVADLEGARVLKYRDVAPLEGSRVGLQAVGIPLDLKSVQVKSRNVYDYTFHDAPTDWQPQHGIWEITNRWSCSPGWSWFGGRSERLAIIWNKRRFPGDVSLEYYAAPKMDAVPEAYAQRFRDLNATICGDGERLNSGYSFIIGGWHNTRTAILRGDRIVADTSSFRLPPQGQGHRLWFHVRIEKRGNRVSLWVNNPVAGAPISDKPLLTFEDPDPLPGDRIALWTQNNGLMLARAVISYQQEREAPIVARRPDLERPKQMAVAPTPPPAQPPSVPIVNDFERGLGQWRGASARLSIETRTASQGRRSLCIENAEPGGEFKAVALSGSVDVTNAPFLCFDYRIFPGVQVNLYVRKGRAYYAIGFTGTGQVNPAAGVLAALEPIKEVHADGAWHRVRYDLLSALRKFFPSERPVVDEIVFANWDPSDEYMLAGVTGNALGARYYIDQFYLGAGSPPAGLLADRSAPAAGSASRQRPDAATRPGKGSGAAATRPVALGPGAPQRAGTASAGSSPDKPGASAQSASAKRALSSAKPAKRTSVRQVANGATLALFEGFNPGRETVRWEAMEGKWAVTKDGFFAPTEKPEYAYAFTGDLNWTDYTLKADLINGQDAGLLVRAQDWNNCVFVVIRPSHRDLWWFVRRNGEWGGVLAPMGLSFGPKEVLQVKVTAIGDTFTCYLDGQKVSQIKDATFPKGRIGVYIHPAEAGQAWDNVEVILAPPSKAVAHN